ncbi:MAG: hypothetical protein SFZ23_09260 [Planctomycetota bacterium]|nr:hypothetical protein [Planctomycetota bacterium]
MRIAVSIASIVASGCASQALAGQVFINSSKVKNLQVGGGVVQAKYRLSNGNFDMSLDRGQGTNPGQFIQANLGNNNQLNNTAFNFVVQHIAGQGILFQMNKASDQSSNALSWGNFSSPMSGQSVSQLGGQSFYGSGRGFNTLLLTARAEWAGNAANPGSSSMSFSNLNFSSSELAVADGAFISGAASTPGTGAVVQQLVSSVDLSQYSWSITGTITGLRLPANITAGDELVSFVIGGKQSEFALIPLPSTAALAGVGMMVMGGARRRSTAV